MAATDYNLALGGTIQPSATGLIEALEKRGVYAIGPAENPTALNPGFVQYIAFNGSLFWYDAADSTTAHDGVSCIVTADGKRYKADGFKTLNSLWIPVLDKDLTAPPGSPALQDTYIVGAGATGAWATKDKNFATWTARGWVFYAPKPFDYAYVRDEAMIYHYSAGGAWTSGIPAITIADSSISRNKINHFKLGPVSVENQTTNAPPGSPSNGDAYIVGGAPSGAWVGKSLQVAIFEGGAWVYYVGYTGAEVYDKAQGKYFRFNGATWDTPAAGVWSLIENRVISSPVATADFIGLSAYKILRLSIVDLRPANNSVRLYFRISSDNGSTFLATGTYEGGAGIGGGPATAYNPLNSTNNLGNGAGNGGLAGEVMLTDFNVAQKTKFISRVAYYTTTPALFVMHDAGAQTAQTAMNAFRMLMSSGNIASAAALILEGAA